MIRLQGEDYISRIYYESMRDNFEGYAWDSGEAGDTGGNDMKKEMLADLKKEFLTLDPLDGNTPTLGQLFKIELALIWLVPKTALRARFWTIEDRFRRVVPTSVIASYEASFKPGPIDSLDEEVLRQRARNLLDVIHANYLINLARENSIKRMMTILAGVAFFIVAMGIFLITTRVEMAQHGLIAIVAAGMFGAMISIIQRLQKATARDAMVEDGIFELIGLRVGWVSVLMSIGIGGVFALFIYVLAAANLLDTLLPDFAGPQPAGGTGVAGGGTAADTLPATNRVLTTDPAPAADGAMAAERAADSVAAVVAPTCSDAGGGCDKWVERVRLSLGLKDAAQFYKMIAFAFAAGFAERFVPDIINKLAKQNAAGGHGSSPGGLSGNIAV